MKTCFKIFGVLIILMAGLMFLFYGRANHNFAEAEKAYIHGDFEGAGLFYEKGLEGFDKLSFSKIPFLNKNVGKIKEKLEDVSRLARAWSIYYQAYYDAEKYKFAEEIVSKELVKEKSLYRDQFYNLSALICWQKGVELFIQLGKKAANSKELGQFLEEAKNSSGEAVKNNDGNDEDIKYNYEFFRKPPEELKKHMQQAAQQKTQDREAKKKGEELAKAKKIKSNKQGQQENEEKKVDKNKDNIQPQVPMEKKERDKAEQETTGDSKNKKKKIG